MTGELKESPIQADEMLARAGVQADSERERRSTMCRCVELERRVDLGKENALSDSVLSLARASLPFGCPIGFVAFAALFPRSLRAGLT